MNIVEINVCDYGSTGKIMLQIARRAEEKGHNAFTFSRKWIKQSTPVKGHTYFGYFVENAFHHILSEITGFSECFSYFGTLKLIRQLKKIKPDIIHLHNLHGWYINLPLLFKYIKKENIKTIWTLHDCWAFTGHCAYFDICGCEKWQSGCKKCSQYKNYPKSWLDNSGFMYSIKKKCFTGVSDMTIITPSNWLSGLVKRSFLKEYPVKVINNGIDLSVFKPTESDFRQKHGLENKFVLLGIAFGWGKRKGLDVFIELSKRLDDNFRIILVGTDDEIDKLLPDNIISIYRTHNQAELAEIYSAADLFVNPTREDNYPTVNMESVACGTPVLTFNTGGSPEMLDETCGIVVERDDVDDMYLQIMKIFSERNYSAENCLKKAAEFNMRDKFDQYVSLYSEKD